MTKFSGSFSKIIIFFITCNVFTSEIYAIGPIQGFFDNISQYGKLFLGETSFYLDDKKFDTQDRIIFSKETFFETIECSKTKDSKVKLGSLTFKDDKNFTIHISNNNVLSLNQENGIINEGSQPVKFHVDKGSTLNLLGAFTDENHLNSGSSSPILFQIDNGSHLNFEGVSPGVHAEVNLGTDSTLTFSKNNNVNSLNALITEPSSNIELNQSSLILGTSGANSTLNSKLRGNKSSQLIKEGRGRMSLNGDCSAFEGTIVVNHGEVDLQCNSSGLASAYLSPNTKLSISQNNSLASLNTHENSETHLNKCALTLGGLNEDSLVVGEIIGKEPSKLIKVGTGTLSLNGKNKSFEGDLIINEGEAILGDCELGGNVIINEDGKLSGSSSIAKNLTNVGGVISLSEIDQLEISGNFIQNEEGECLLGVNKYGQTGHFKVEGIAKFNSNSLKVYGEDFRLGSPYVLVEAEMIEGNFQNLNFLGSLPRSVEGKFTQEFSENKEKLILKFIANLVRDGQTSNQHNVAEQIKTVNNSKGEYDQPLNHLVQLDEETIPKALNQLSGEQYTQFILANERTTEQFIRRIYTPLQTVSIDHDCEELRMNKWISWAGLEFGKSFQKGIHGYDMKECNFTASIQKSMNDWLTESCPLAEIVPCGWLTGWTAGLAGSYAYQQYEFNHGSEANLHNAKGAFYTLLTKPVYYLLLDFIVGGTAGKMERSIKFDQIDSKALSDLRLYHASFYGELGLNNIFCYNFRLQPFIGIEAGYYHFCNCNEHGAELFDLKINAHSDCLATSYVGLHFFNFQNDDTMWGISADVIWKHLFEYDNHLEGKFARFGDKFKISGQPNSQNGIEGTLTYFQRINDCWLINAEISGEGWANYSNIYLSIGCSYNW